MEREAKISLCQNLATIILTRLFADTDVDITEEDVHRVELFLRNGIVIFGQPDVPIKISGICNQCEHVHNEQLLPYINKNKNLKALKEFLDMGTLKNEVEIKSFDNKVVCYYTDATGIFQQLSFTIIANKSKNKVYGVGETVEDYGFDFHKDYLQKLFGCTLGKIELYAYLNTVTNDGVTDSSILQATKELYKTVSDSVWSKLENGPASNYFTFLNRIFTSINCDFVHDANFKVKKARGKIVDIDYKSLFTLLRFIEIDVTVEEEPLPSIVVVDTKSNRTIFHVAIETEDCDTSPTGKKYSVKLKVGDAVSYIIKKWRDYE